MALAVQECHSPEVEDYKVNILVVDDQPEAFDAIKTALDGTELLRFTYYESPEAFAQSRIQNVAVCILDIYFNTARRSEDRCIEDLITTARAKWPGAALIILTNYPGRQATGFRDRVVALVPKIEFMLRKPILRAAVIKGLREYKGGNRPIVESVIAHFTDRDLADESEEIHEIELGDIYYPLRRPTKVLCGKDYYTLEGLDKFLVGKGEVVDDARKVFICQFHESYQRMLRTRTIFRRVEHETLYAALEDIVDKAKYDEVRTVIIPHEIGEVVETNERKEWTIRWHTGEMDTISLERVPELATVEPGQWIKAAVVRKYLTNAFVKILHLILIPPPVYSAEAQQEFWNQGKSGEGAK